MGYLCANRKDILFGGTNDAYYEELSKIFSRLSENAELFFFMDGFIPEHKYPTWQKRQNSKYSDSIKVIKKIQEKVSLSEIARTSKPYVNTMLTVIEAVAIKYGTLKYTVHHECDQEIAQFAAQHWRVLAVFSEDTDFLIFGGRWRYFSMKRLNAHTFRTKEYSRQALKTYINLSDFQLSIWATCLGNDVVPHSSIKKFHDHFKKDKFLEIADLVRTKCMTFKHYDDLLRYFTISLFGYDDEVGKHLINTSINAYSIFTSKEDEVEGPFDYLLNSHKLFTRNVLSNAPFNFSLIFFDLDAYNAPTYFDIAVPMFARQAGIVFKQAQIEGFNLKVYTKQFSGSNHELHQVPPIFPPFEVLSMREINSSDILIDEHRFRLLAWSICWEKLRNFNLRQIPSRYMIDVLTLVFLVQNYVITTKEADIFLLSIKNVEQGKVKVQSKPSILDPRAFHIAFVYTKTFTNVLRSFEICGLAERYGVS